MLTHLANYARAALIPTVTTRRPTRRCPDSSEVQSILFDRSRYTVARAKAWAEKHHFRHNKVDVTVNYIRLRQKSPKLFSLMRTKTFGRGIKAIVGWRDC
jgi:hypothetical protein